MMEPAKEDKGPDLERIGLFKEMSYHHEYVPMKISFNDASKKGKQMMTNCSKSKAGNQDGFFDKSFLRVFEEEGYFDRIAMNRKYRLENAKKNRPEIFKYSSPTKKSCGKGSNYGTFAQFCKPVEHFSSKVRETGKLEPPKKNVFTNPPRKGTGYGYPNVTIGRQPPYFLDEELKNAVKEPKKPVPRPFQPYRAGKFPKDYFNENPFREDEGVLPPKEETEKESAEKAEKKEPFKPSNPAKKDGGMKAGCLSRFPQHECELYPKIELIPRGVKHYVNSQNQLFKPVPGVRPYPVKSIIHKNVEKKVNSTNFNAIKGVVYCKNNQTVK